MNIALFDFDGTITFKDSLIEFVKFSVGKMEFVKGIVTLLPILLFYKIGLIENYVAKQVFISHFFKGMKETQFREIAEEFSCYCIDKIVRPKSIERIKWHKKQGDKVVVVSASLECYLKPWCEKNGLDLVATKLEMKNGIVTGRLLTENCYGIEKVRRIKNEFDLRKYEKVYVYGDSRGDKEMLQLGTNRFYRRLSN